MMSKVKTRFDAGFRAGYEKARLEALEIIRRLIPCRCGPEYIRRGLKAPDCPWHCDGQEVELALSEMRSK